jgi:hypothetical protein
MVNINLTMSIIVLHISGVITAIKDKDFSEWIKKPQNLVRKPDLNIKSILVCVALIRCHSWVIHEKQKQSHNFASWEVHDQGTGCLIVFEGPVPPPR